MHVANFLHQLPTKAYLPTNGPLLLSIYLLHTKYGSVYDNMYNCVTPGSKFQIALCI